MIKIQFEKTVKRNDDSSKLITWLFRPHLYCFALIIIIILFESKLLTLYEIDRMYCTVKYSKSKPKRSILIRLNFWASSEKKKYIYMKKKKTDRTNGYYKNWETSKLGKTGYLNEKILYKLKNCV